MKKEEILEKSRKENKNKDIYEKEVIIRGNKCACIAAMALATIFFIVQIVVGGGINYGLYAVIEAALMGRFWYMFFKLHRKSDLVLAILYSVLVVLLSVAQILNIVTMSTSL